MHPFSSTSTDSGQAAIHIISGPERIKQNYISLVKRSQEEILLVIPTINALRREQSIGIFEELQQAVKRGVRIKLLAAEDDFIIEMLDRLRASGIIVRKIETPTEAKFKMLIVDKSVVFIVETRDDSKGEFKDAIGNAIFSNSVATVRPYVTIFESFWRETDLYEKAMEAERVKDEFVHIAAHELRNPIMPLLSGAELLSDLLETNKAKFDSKTLDELKKISVMLTRNATKLFRLSEDILQVSRIENHNFNLDFQPTSLNEILETAVDDVKKRYAGDRNEVSLVVDRRYGKDLALYCDGTKVLQVLMNLLDNAMKFTTIGTVTVTAATRNSELLISVKDSGGGVDPEIRSRLFEKFATKSTQGTGLGLYLCKMIVEAHGGKIWFEDNPGGTGSIFSFTLPTDDRMTVTEVANKA